MIYFICLLALLFNLPIAAEYKASDFFDNSGIYLVDLNPSGTKVIFTELKDDNEFLVWLDTNTMKKNILFEVSELSKEVSVRDIRWIDDRHILVKFLEKRKGVLDLLETKTTYRLLIFKLPTELDGQIKIYTIQTKGYVVDTLPETENKILFAKSNNESSIYEIDVNKLNTYKAKITKKQRIDGGQFSHRNRVLHTNGLVTRWFFVDNEVTSVLKFNDKRNLVFHTIDSNGSTDLLKVWTYKQLTGKPIRKKASKRKKAEAKLKKLEKLLFPIAATNEKYSYYCLDYNEEENTTIYKVNFKTGVEEVVFESNDFSVIGIVLSSDGSTIKKVNMLKNGKIFSRYFNSDKDEYIYDINSNIRTSVDSTKKLYFYERFDRPSVYKIIDATTKSENIIGQRYSKIPKPKSKIVLKEGSVEVESLKIPYILTEPENGAVKKGLVVWVHGGPYLVFDDIYFNRIPYFFNLLGYGVLRINFRGSSGHGEGLKNAGTGQFGKLMLEDILKVSETVQSDYNYTAQKTCIAGGSYGGYAATMLAISNPKVFSCAVNISGISDVNLLLNNSKFTISKSQAEYSKKYIGDVVDDYQGVINISPIYLAKSLSIPILIAHGYKDEVVDIEHAYRLKMILERYVKEFEFYVYQDSKHSFNSDDEQDLFQKIVYFIDKHIN